MLRCFNLLLGRITHVYSVPSDRSSSRLLSLPAKDRVAGCLILLFPEYALNLLLSVIVITAAAVITITVFAVPRHMISIFKKY
jgi:hypothetical protein